MKTRGQTTYCIGRRADQSGLRPLVRNQVEVEKYVTGTKSFPEHPSEPENRENTNLTHLIHHLRRISQNQKE